MKLLLDRLGEKIDFGDCWEWTAAKDPMGYGRVSQPTYGESLAHRAVWVHVVGPIPDGLHLDHLCRNRACVNPDHLEPVTQRENSLRGDGPAGTRARQTECIRGHAFDEKNTYYSKNGTRGCRACHNRRERDRQRGIQKADVIFEELTKEAVA